MTMVSGSDGKITLQFDLSSCEKHVNSMNELDLKVSEENIMLVAQSNARSWRAKFPHSIDVGSVSAKFLKKQQVLEVVCMKK